VVGKMDRYLQNKTLISSTDQEKLSESKVMILGVGGLGGYATEMLARIGIGTLILVDFDRFDMTNLNRQILATESNLGSFKVEEAKKRVATINSEVEVITIDKKITSTNIHEIIEGVDIVVDGLDDSMLKKVVESSCSKLNIPMVHGAINGFIGQVAMIMPGDFILDKIYGDKKIKSELGNPSFIPPLVASIQVGEVIKYILKKGENMSKEILYIDLENNTFTPLKI
jgi:molybdopterin/thiamine biosynthesis adenylyltransferase